MFMLHVSCKCSGKYAGCLCVSYGKLLAIVAPPTIITSAAYPYHPADGDFSKMPGINT